MDRFYRGFVAGILAAIPIQAWSFFSYYVLNLEDRRLIDWAVVLIFGSAAQLTAHFILGSFMQLAWSGFRGVLFSYLLLLIGKQGLAGKAIIYSVVGAFFENTIAVLFKVPHLAETTTGTVISTLISAILWGALVAYIHNWLEERVSA